MCERVPGSDHTSFYARDKKLAAIVTEPYQLSFGQMKELIEFCDARGLRADIDADSSHFPSRTIRIIIQRQDEWENKYKRAK